MVKVETINQTIVSGLIVGNYGLKFTFDNEVDKVKLECYDGNYDSTTETSRAELLQLIAELQPFLTVNVNANKTKGKDK